MGGRGGGGEGRGGRGVDPLVLVVSVASLTVEDVVKNIGEERANLRRDEGRVLCVALLCPRTPGNPLRLRRGVAVCQSGGAWQGRGRCMGERRGVWQGRRAYLVSHGHRSHRGRCASHHGRNCGRCGGVRARHRGRCAGHHGRNRGRCGGVRARKVPHAACRLAVCPSPSKPGGSKLGGE